MHELHDRQQPDLAELPTSHISEAVSQFNPLTNSDCASEAHSTGIATAVTERKA